MDREILIHSAGHVAFTLERESTGLDAAPRSTSCSTGAAESAASAWIASTTVNAIAPAESVLMHKSRTNRTVALGISACSSQLLP